MHLEAGAYRVMRIVIFLSGVPLLSFRVPFRSGFRGADQETVGEVLMLIATWGLTFGRTMGWGVGGGGVHHRSGVDLRKGSPRHDGGNEMARSLSVPLNLYFS